MTPEEREADLIARGYVPLGNDMWMHPGMIQEELDRMQERVERGEPALTWTVHEITEDEE